MRFNHPILLLQTIRLGLCFLSIWWGNPTLFFPTVHSHALWRWQSLLVLIGIDRSYWRNNRSSLLRHPTQDTLFLHIYTYMHLQWKTTAAVHNSGGASRRHPHQLWGSSVFHPLHPISLRNHCFTRSSISLFIRKPTHASQDNMPNKPWWIYKEGNCLLNAKRKNIYFFLFICDLIRSLVDIN